MDDSWTLVDGDEVGIGRDCQLLVEIVMEEGEVVADEVWDQDMEEKMWKSRAWKDMKAQVSDLC